MRMDIDHMSYEELLALGEQIGNAGSGLSEDFISGGLLFNMMIRVAVENQQGGVAAIDHGEMPNNFTCGNKSLYNDRVGSFAAVAGEGQDSKGSKRCSSSSDNINILVRHPSSSSSSHEGGLCEVESTFRERELRKPPSPDLEGATEGHNSKTGGGGGGGKKKGKKGRQIEPTLLGFKVTSNRIMIGEIQCIQD
ncbi:unnamed protein product [Lactuca saligna]|uniref:Uncharacterized protein n=1 Tax=Lactuca saligna TaxID=75948 RepID=A0AA35YZM3_LACSI|nr:unnamed protein product [Lactuca saligna]